MVMSDADILKEYRQAKSKPDQLVILADLNCCSVPEMKMYLGDLGVDVADSLHHRADWVKGLELYRQGKTDDEIAEAMKVAKTTVASWRWRNKFPANLKKKGKKMKETASVNGVWRRSDESLPTVDGYYFVVVAELMGGMPANHRCHALAFVNGSFPVDIGEVVTHWCATPGLPAELAVQGA